MQNPQALIRLFRPHQWVKNGFVLLGVIFAHRWDIPTLLQALTVFLAFCAVSSSAYVLNDILDVKADRSHPTKCRRPIASGAVSVAQGWWWMGSLAMVALGLAARVSATAAVFIASYLLLNAAYSVRLKHVVILDVFVISAGFMLRILAGTSGIDIAPSHWLLLCGLMLTLFLGFAKRRAELLAVESSGKASPALTRQVLDDYSPAVLDLFLGVTAACAILSYGLYTMSPETMAQHGTDKLVYTLPFIVYGMFRYIHLLHDRGRGSDTANDLLDDRHLTLVVLSWLLVTLWLLA